VKELLLAVGRPTPTLGEISPHKASKMHRSEMKKNADKQTQAEKRGRGQGK
jgi:hypothetical protein